MSSGDSLEQLNGAIGSKKSATVQVLVDDSGNRDVIRRMLDPHFTVTTQQRIRDADLYLIEDNLFDGYHQELQKQVKEQQPAFCPVVLIRRGSTSFTFDPPGATGEDQAILIDEVIDAPIDKSLLIQRLHSLLIRRKQSMTLLQQVTSLEEREHELRRFEQAVESSGNGIILIDSSGHIGSTNPAFRETTGYRTIDIAGQSPACLLPTEAEAMFTDDFWKNVIGRGEWQGELVMDRKEGKRIVASVTITPIQQADQVEGFVMVISDITEQIQREQALADSEEQLDLLRQVLMRFLRHNLRNDLNVVLGYAQMLVEEDEHHPEHRQWATKIIEVTERLVAKSEKAHSYSSFLKQDSDLVEINLSDVILSVVEEIQQTHPQVIFELDVSHGCIVQGHDTISLAIRSLIENAVTHNDSASPRVDVQLRENQGANLVITDNGPGIPTDELKPLDSGEETALSHSQGIGLWMSKWVIEGLGGELRFDTSTNGTQVIVEIPPAGDLFEGSLDIPSIKEREQRLESVLDRMTDAVLEVDASWRILFLDSRAEEILGVEAERILGEPFWKEFSAARNTAFEDSYHKAMEHRTTERITDYYSSIDTWLEVVTYPEFGGGLTFFFRDVTEQVEQQLELRELEERYAAMVELSHDILTVIDTDGIIRYQSPAIESELGYSQDELVGEHVFEFVHPDDQSLAIERFETLLQESAPNAEITEFRFKDAAGEWVWFEAVASHMMDSSVEGVLINSRNITERKAYDDLLTNAHERIRFALEATNATVWEWDIEADTITTFPDLHTAFASEVLKIDDFLTGILPDDRSHVEDAIESAIHSGTTYQVRYRVPTGDGIRWLEDQAEIRYENGRPIEMIGTARDITESKRDEVELRERVKELHALHQARQIFDETDRPLGELLREFIVLIPTAFQYPERTGARITYEGDQYSTDNFNPGGSTIESSTNISEQTAVTAEVTLLKGNSTEGDTPFLQEDQELLDTLVSIVRAELVERSAKADLERLEELFSTAEEMGNVGVWEANLDSGELFWSEGTRRIHEVGRTFEPSLEQAIQFYLPDDQSVIADTIETSINTGNDYTVTARLRTANDSLRWIRTGGRMIEGAGTLRGYIQDITEHQELQQELSASEERLRVALAAGDLGMWELDLQSEASPVRSFRHDEIFGYDEPVADWSFETFLEHVHPDDRKAVRESFDAAFGDGSWHFTCRINRVDGVERWIDAHGLFFFDDETNEASHAIGIVGDVTEEKQTERELREKTARLEEFTRMVTHDIKNPLSVAKGRLALFQERNKTDDLTAVGKALSRIEDITTDLSTLARFGPVETDRRSVSLEQTAQAAWNMIDTRDARLVTEDAEIMADQSQLQGIFENLFKNAIGHGGSNVTVRVGPLPDGFYIEDTGTGIPENIRERVFQSGFSTGYSGSGIGLTIVARIVEAHDWKLELGESAEGGARFEIRDVVTPSSSVLDDGDE